MLLGLGSFSMASVVTAMTVPGYSITYLVGNVLLLGISLYAMSKLLRYLVVNYEMAVRSRK
jgi:hypothetical protein